MILREGMDPTVAIGNLADLIGRLERAGSAFARPGDWQAAQNGYLQVVETVEWQLASLFEDDDGTAAGLFGEQYKMIREMSASTPRPEPLIGLEAGRQAAALRRLVSGVTALRALRDRKGVPVVLDTNVLMHYHRPDRVLWAEVIGCASVRLVLPICVLDELDSKKYADSDRMSRRADMAVRALREHSSLLVVGAQRDDRGRVEEELPDLPNLESTMTSFPVTRTTSSRPRRQADQRPPGRRPQRRRELPGRAICLLARWAGRSGGIRAG